MHNSAMSIFIGVGLSLGQGTRLSQSLGLGIAEFVGGRIDRFNKFQPN